MFCQYPEGVLEESENVEEAEGISATGFAGPRVIQGPVYEFRSLARVACVRPLTPQKTPRPTISPAPAIRLPAVAAYLEQGYYPPLTSQSVYSCPAGKLSDPPLTSRSSSKYQPGSEIEARMHVVQKKSGICKCCC